MGILSGHVYHFGTQIWPNLGGSKFLALPAWFKSLLGPIQNLSSRKLGSRKSGPWGLSSLLSVARNRSLKGRKLASSASEPVSRPDSVAGTSVDNLEKKRKPRNSPLASKNGGESPNKKSNKNQTPRLKTKASRNK